MHKLLISESSSIEQVVFHSWWFQAHNNKIIRGVFIFWTLQDVGDPVVISIGGL